jgi:hypothetical protein
VFASLPTLSRLHDRLSASDDAGRFRLSKNIERPHEKHSPAPLVRVAWFAPDETAVDPVAAPVSRHPHQHSEVPAPVRAPPAR